MEDGQLTCTDNQKAEVLSSRYSTVFTHEDMNVIPHLPERQTRAQRCLNRIHISDEDVERKLKALKTSIRVLVQTISTLGF